MTEATPAPTMQRTTMLGIVTLAAVCLAGSAHPQSYSAEELARRMIQRSIGANWAPADRKHEFERMFRLYEPPQAWQLPDMEEIPTEGRAVSPADER